MKFALVNPAWTFEGSTYFGCRAPHYPLELLFAFDKIREAGHEPLLIDAQLEKLSIPQVKQRTDRFEPDRIERARSILERMKREEIYANTYVDLEHLRTNIELFIEHPLDRFCIWSCFLFGQAIRAPRPGKRVR